MRLSDSQWRVLSVLATTRQWVTLPELAAMRALNPGDTECVGSLVDLKLVELASGLRARLTPAGQVIAEEPRQ